MFNSYKNPIIIYNPNAAGGKVKYLFEKYYAKLVHAGLFKTITVYESFLKENTIKKIKEIYKEKKIKHDLIISVGGDGSLSTICNALMGIPITKRLPIFPLPLGSGNSLLRDYNILTIDDAINHYKTQKPKMYDVIHCKETKGKFSWYCINVLGGGFVSDIAQYVVDKGKKWGAFSYVLGTVLALGNFKPYDTVIKYIDEKNKKQEFKSKRVFFMTLSNTKYTGGKIMIAPEAKHDDNLIDVILLHDLNRIQFLNGFRKVFKGKHINDKGCLYFKAKSLEINAKPDYYLMPDGELEGHSPIKVNIIPKQIKLIV